MQAAPGGFLVKYCAESRLLAEAIGHADTELKAELLDSVEQLERDL